MVASPTIDPAGPIGFTSTKTRKAVKTANAKNSPYQVESFIGRTCTDADKIHFAGEGIVTALLSLPLRYMHSPAEVCHVDDIENAIELLAEFLCTIDENTDLNPFS